MRNTKDGLLALALALVITGTFALTSGHFENPDAHLRLSQSFSLVDAGTFQLDSDVGNILHGNVATNDQGERYSVYNPGQIIFFAPAAYLAQYRLFSTSLHPHYLAEIISSFLGVAFHFFTGIVVFLTARVLRRSQKESVLLTLIFLFCTFNLPSSRDGYEHVFEAFFVTCAYYLAWHARSGNGGEIQSKWYVMAGLFLGLGIIFRTTSILALPGLLIICGNRTNISKLLLGIGPGVMILAVYNQMRFGSPLETGYSQAWLLANPDLFETRAFTLREILPNALALWFSPGKGMLYYSPILISLLLLHWKFWKHQRRDMAAVITTALSYTFFYAANFAWHGSAWSWGPRYLIPIVPLLILLLPVMNYSDFRARIVLMLIGLSAFTQIGAVLVNYKLHLLEVYTTRPTAFDDDSIFFEYGLSPILALPKNLFYLFHRSLGSDSLYLFIPPGPWKNEARAVSIETMLESSVDLNVFDLWWIRILYYPYPDYVKYGSLFIGLLATAGLIYTILQLVNRVRQ